MNALIWLETARNSGWKQETRSCAEQAQAEAGPLMLMMRANMAFP
jgi:hypothetical protein